MSNLYSEILKMQAQDLYGEEYYSIPLTFRQLTDIMDLIAENGDSVLLSDIRNYLREEYEIDYIPFYEKN